MNINKMLKQCMKPHPLLHSIAGIGLGLLLTALVPSLVVNAFTLGIVLIVVGVAGEFLLK